MEYAGGIAERTRAMVDAARSVNPQAVVAGTRKHYPGGKRIALAGLLAGGGTVHRLGLSDSILVFAKIRTAPWPKRSPTTNSTTRGVSPSSPTAISSRNGNFRGIRFRRWA